MAKNNPRSGRFIVIDGTDGSGKATQTHLLIERLKKENFPVKMMEFPQFGKKSCGPVEEYLNGKYGTSESVGPYKASIFYAVDRFDASFEIRNSLQKGVHVISNRYVSANMGHQASKITNKKERKKFLKWLYDLEYNRFQIPKPDLNIILHVSSPQAQLLIKKKQPRRYLLDKKLDVHEQDMAHIKNTEKTYLEIAKTFSDFKLVECMDTDKKLLTPHEIHKKVWDVVMNHLNSKS